jgi:hypothetical protein
MVNRSVLECQIELEVAKSGLQALRQAQERRESQSILP